MANKHILSVLLIILLPAMMLRGDDMAVRKFIWEQANSRMASAKQPDDFLEAARQYNRLVEMKVESGAVFYNLGTALLLAGDTQNSLRAFKRSERRIGLTPALSNNMRQVMVQQTGQPDASLPWPHIAFFWHYELPCRLRAYLALSGWLLVWLALYLRAAFKLKKPSIFKSLSGAMRAAGILLLAVFGISVAVTLATERHDQKLWPDLIFATHIETQEEVP